MTKGVRFGEQIGTTAVTERCRIVQIRAGVLDGNNLPKEFDVKVVVWFRASLTANGFPWAS